MNRLLLLAALVPLLVLAGCSTPMIGNRITLQSGECNFTASQVDEVAVGDITQLEVFARSGALTLVGKDGIADVRVEARACASDERLLEQLGIKTSQSGDAIRLEVLFPSQILNGSAWVDLTVEVPLHMAARVDRPAACSWLTSTELPRWKPAPAV